MSGTNVVKDQPITPLSTPNRKLYGVLVRKECWQLSLKGKAMVAAIALVTALIGLFNLQPFLAVTHREDSKILVVEGWIDQYAILTAVKEFQAGHYEKIYTTGGPVVGTGGYVNDFNTSASIGAEVLKSFT